MLLYIKINSLKLIIDSVICLEISWHAIPVHSLLMPTKLPNNEGREFKLR